MDCTKILLDAEFLSWHDVLSFRDGLRELRMDCAAMLANHCSAAGDRREAL